MNLSYKLRYLMDLTSTNSSQLASVLNVDPSLVSRLRNGKRNLPRNAEYIKPMCDYFASRITSKFQQESLESYIGEKNNESINPENIAETIETWILNLNQSTSSISYEILTNNDTKEALPTISTGDKTEIFTFYGEAGKRNANLFFEELILSSHSKCHIKIMTEGNLDWLWEDNKYSLKITENIKKAVNKGFDITRIEPRNQNITMAFDTVDRWVPLYLTGRINSYYYPYHRDQIINHTLYLAPGVAALSSASIGKDAKSNITTVTTDPKMVKAYAEEYDSYLKLCKPSFHVYYFDEKSKTREFLKNYHEQPSDCIAILGGLSLITTPTNIIPTMDESDVNSYAFNLKNVLETANIEFSNQLTNYNYTEVIALDSYEDIKSGKIECIANSIFQGKPIYYSTKGYIEHLENIINLLQLYSNYNIVLTSERNFESSLYIKDGYQVLLFSKGNYGAFYKLEYQEMVAAIWEYAKNQLVPVISAQDYKRYVIEELKEFIKRLETSVIDN